MTKQYGKRMKHLSLTCMSRPGTDLLRLPIEASDALRPSRRSSVDTCSVMNSN